MKLIKNQKGLTLVELLGALTLIFILGIGVFGTLSNSLNLFQRESSRIDVRGQANIIANHLTTFYQEIGDFEICYSPNGDKRDVVIVEREGFVDCEILVEEAEMRKFSLPSHQITIVAEPSIPSGPFTKREITITITGESEEFILETVVSRLKGNTQ